MGWVKHFLESAGWIVAAFLVLSSAGRAMNPSNTSQSWIMNQPSLSHQNSPPQARFSFSPSTVSPGDSIQFTDASNDPDGSIVGWLWNFGDDSPPSRARNTTHAYAAPGAYTVTLTVTDSSGDTDTCSKTVSVMDKTDESSIWCLVWSDEFNGSSVDRNNWKFETGGGGWGNNELQYYTDGANARVENGMLIITARKESVGGRSYTSARMKTKGLREFMYGRVEARLSVPMGQGLWPAFWMLGTNIESVGWPRCGEIDIMEHINNERRIHGTMHWNNGGHVSSGSSIENPTPDSFHTYAIEWDPLSIKWYQDDVLYHQEDIANGVNGTEEFHQPFFIILNLAVGGNWPGAPNASTQFPAEFRVDYVRVYCPYFAVTVDKASGVVQAGGSLHVDLRVSVLDEYSETINLSASGQHPGVTVRFSPRGGTGEFTSTMSISTEEDVPEGTYPITVTATGSDGRRQSIIFNLVVRSAASSVYSVYSDAGIPYGSEVWTWNGMNASFEGRCQGESPPEGKTCFQTCSQNWAGWGVFLIYPSDHTVDLSSYTCLKFWVKTSHDLKVEIEAPRGRKHTRYISRYGWDGTERWQEITIPASDFGNLDSVWSPFLITTSNPGDFYVDNVRWIR